MFKRALPGIAVLAFWSTSALAGTITQSIPFDYSPLDEGVTFPVIQGFDSQGGTRQLTNVTFDFHHNFAAEVFIESTGPTAVSAGDFSFNIGLFTVFQLGEVTKENPNPPFFGPGSFFAGDITSNLAAYDGIAGNDGPDSYRPTLTDAFSTSQSYLPGDDPLLYTAITDVGALTTVYGGFLEFFGGWINDPNWPQPPKGFPEYPTDAALWFSWSSFRHSGSMTITYDYAEVPAPMSVLPLAGLALITRRRR